jgi:hypothetical protein
VLTLPRGKVDKAQACNDHRPANFYKLIIILVFPSPKSTARFGPRPLAEVNVLIIATLPSTNRVDYASIEMEMSCEESIIIYSTS